jgi:CDGSH-type Zn-finger protein
MATEKQTSKKALKFKIIISKNGPYLVSGGVPLAENVIVTDADGYSYEWRRDKEYPVQENYKLCRCGQSKNKPFCDGTHLQINFNGTETASRESYFEQAGEISGSGLELTDATALCAHASFCDRAGGIWELIERSDEPEARRIAIEEAANCPSGRLVVWDKEGNEIESEFEPSIELVEEPHKDVSGPIWVRGNIQIESADGTTYEVRDRVTLCRCGKSANKPFCDGTDHNK